MRKVVAGLVVVLTLAVGAAIPAAAHTPDRFTICVARSRTAPGCSVNVLAIPGETLYIRGRISGHGGHVRLMLGGPPHSIGSPVIRADGTIRATWRVPDIGLFYLWLVKPGHGETRVSVQVSAVGGQ